MLKIHLQLNIYQMSYSEKNIGVKDFLSSVNLKLRETKPAVPKTLNYTVMENNGFVEIWFKTVGCQYSKKGSCTFCDYWYIPEIEQNIIHTFVSNAIKSLKLQPKTILLQTSGSLFDAKQVPINELEQILKLFSNYPNLNFIFETHLNSISDTVLKICRKILPENKISVEVGVETLNKWTLKYSLNKSINISTIKKKIALLNNYNIEPIANILIGAPFICSDDIINETIETIQWCFKNGFNRCVLFPVNIKKWTLVSWLYENDFYEQPSLWLFVEILHNIPKKYLNSIEIVWFSEREQLNPSYQDKDIPPTTCSVCYPEVISLLNQFGSNYHDRQNILNQLKEIDCNCKHRFYATLIGNDRAILQNVYKQIGKRILGNEYWLKNKETILSDITEYLPLRGSHLFTNNFLNTISHIVRKDRISYWDTEEFSIRTDKKEGKIYGGLWFKTEGCSHDKRGGCSICDYSNGKEVSSEQIISYVKKGLLTLSDVFEDLIVTPSGSFLDEFEVLSEARTGILDLLRKTQHKQFSFETRADTITEEKIIELKSILKERISQIYIGVETSNALLLKYAINKNLDLQKVIRTYKILNRHNIKSISNILLGVPFLTEKEAIEDTVSSVKWCLKHGSSKCCIFPVHIKNATIGEKLFNLGLYKVPSLWSLVEVLKRLEKEIKQNKIEISWYTNMGAYNIVQSPTTCPDCFKKVIDLFNEFNSMKDFVSVEKLDAINCSCRKQWEENSKIGHNLDLNSRISIGYKKLALP